MPRIKYHYDTETCKYEPVKKSKANAMMDLLVSVSLILIGAVCILVVYLSYYDSPNEKFLRRENEKLVFRMEILNKNMTHMDHLLAQLQNRDDNIYRTIFEQDPIASSIRNAGIGGAKRYEDLINKELENEEYLLKTLTQFDQLKRQMYIQTKSYDELLSLANKQHLMLASIPAITPISLKQSYLSSGFGLRYHPIHKVRKMHTGIDFGARIGTPVYATGGGVVSKVSTSFYGYGRQIEIDHGFGFKTKYAHLSEFNVKVGQKVKRGELIAFSGNSGTSSGPHLHYEVFKNRKKVNPIHYFYQDISDQEFERLVELASIENESM
uniref:M23 family metallopeptidase n=1 Tax=Roseihalotalea indica TaxID=2867963 RepID=A0AA49GQT7_9BACT|nr:M23 family metallopeptidase [Tunicatimonas sp. TK19036]